MPLMSLPRYRRSNDTKITLVGCLGVDIGLARIRREVIFSEGLSHMCNMGPHIRQEALETISLTHVVSLL